MHSLLSDSQECKKLAYLPFLTFRVIISSLNLFDFSRMNSSRGEDHRGKERHINYRGYRGLDHSRSSNYTNTLADSLISVLKSHGTYLWKPTSKGSTTLHDGLKTLPSLRSPGLSKRCDIIAIGTWGQRATERTLTGNSRSQ